ncbi:hypothetical protein WMY93_011354 [Mugilogobius chulae]|uniref:Uncharacterized protein n=1 Tax=Mugilogobius chulae TaxID=88201 RepID=A0AAW0PEE5_9GOBI
MNVDPCAQASKKRVRVNHHLDAEEDQARHGTPVEKVQVLTARQKHQAHLADQICVSRQRKISSALGPPSGSAQPDENRSNSVSQTKSNTSRDSDCQSYRSAMAANAVFHQFPEPSGEQQRHQQLEVCKTGENERFIQRRFPMLYVNLTAQEHPAIADIQCGNDGSSQCSLCKLDGNTLDSIKVLKPHEVKPYLDSYQHKFSEEQVNVHLAHTMRGGENALACLAPVAGSTSAKENGPYGYAPYVWISISLCNPHDNWCVGRSMSGFALTLDYLNQTSDMCTHYCPGMIIAHWRPLEMKRDNMGQYKQEGLALGAYVKRLDRASCHEVPGGFKCHERVVKSTPLNKVSILLHANPRNRDYFFGMDPMADCEPDPQCAAYKFLRRTLFASPAERIWPDTNQVLSIRNSAYACVLSYAGLGDIDSVGTCYAQFGDRCFFSEGNRFCIGNSRQVRVGLTNADRDASGPIAVCEISDSTSHGQKDPEMPTAHEIRNFLGPSSCDAAVLSLDRFAYNMDNRHLSVALDISTFHVVAEVAHVILRVPLDECVIQIAPENQAYSSSVNMIAKTLTKVLLSSHSTGIMLDATEWGNSGRQSVCPASVRANSRTFIQIVRDVASALNNLGVPKLFLRLPRAHSILHNIDLAQMTTIDGFITPKGVVDMSRFGYCQNMWINPHGTSDSDPSKDTGVVPYLLNLLKTGIPGNRIIFTLSLTGGLKISAVENRPEWTTDIIDDLSLADMETNSLLKCKEDLNTKCCSGSMITVWERNLMVNLSVTSTSFETLKRFPELVVDAFGINQFIITPVNSDFKRGIRSDTPAILGITSAIHRLRNRNKQQLNAMATAGNNRATAGLYHGRAKRSISYRFRRTPKDLDEQTAERDSASQVYKDPASGSKNCLDPQYNFGLSNVVVCPGLLVCHGALGVFKEPHREFYSTRYEKIYIVNLHKLYSCTPGEPIKKAVESHQPPQLAINVNTLVPTTDARHYTVGILNSEELVEYIPPVNKVCTEHNTGPNVHSMHFAAIDNGYTFTQPVVRYDEAIIVKPPEIMFFVSNFSLGVDYINLNISCIDYDVSALKPCLIAICGGDESCRKDHGRLCDSAHEIIDDARRAGVLMREGLEELATQELKATMYQLPDDLAQFPGLNQERRARKKRFIGGLLGAAALATATYVAHKVHVIEKQMDLFQNTFVKVTNDMVEVSRKLDENIGLVNTRIDEQERKLQQNNEIISRNVQLLRDAILRNTEAATRDTNVKFSIMASYQMWYAQMQSITHQLTQAAMHTKFMARGVEDCLRQIALKRSGSCSSGLQVMQNHPGLADFPTVAGALYKSRKLFIVHSVPGNVEKTIVRGIIPMPNLSTDGVPCWPDYKVWLIEGNYYEETECHGRYCHLAQSHEKYLKCLSNPEECKTVCGMCHRGVCYQNGKFTWQHGTSTVENALPGVNELEVLQAINTSVKLIDVREDLDNITRTIEEFDKQYNELKAQRVSFGGWLSAVQSSGVVFRGGHLQYTCAIDMWSLGVMIADAMERKYIFRAFERDGVEVSTYDIMVKSLCPSDDPRASSEPWDLTTVMPNVMKCDRAKRIVMKLLTFCEAERLLAHELLQDLEWMQTAEMTERDKCIVKYNMTV